VRLLLASRCLNRLLLLGIERQIAVGGIVERATEGGDGEGFGGCRDVDDVLNALTECRRSL